LARETQASLSIAMELVPGLGQTSIRGKASPTSAQVETHEASAEWVQGLTDGLTPVTRPTVGVVGPFIELLSTPNEEP
jgi:hypothetical protein